MHDERSLLALQGPAAVKAVQALCKDDLSSLYFSHFRRAELGGVPVWLTRTGYTGEDGFEISVPNGRAAELAQALLDKPGMRLCGEAAPPSIRATYHPSPLRTLHPRISYGLSPFLPSAALPPLGVPI